jgi:uroporphyrinogen-III synthase
MTDRLTILSTKILDPEARDYALAQGWVLREEAFIEVRPLAASDLPDDRPLMVFTSENGVVFSPGFRPAQGATGLSLIRVACLEGKTLTAVRGRWPDAEVVCTGKNAATLAEAIAAHGFRKALFLCAREHRPELPEALRAAGIEVIEIPVYETIKAPKVIDTPFDALLFFSPSAAESFFRLNVPGKAQCFAIGGTTAAAISAHTDNRIITSDAPTQAAILESVGLYFNTSPLRNEHTEE